MNKEINIKQDNHTITGVLTLPNNYNNQTPVIIMLHGTGSDKNEAGNGYVRLAAEMEIHNIASFRFDFIGTGNSDLDYQYYNFKSATKDVEAVVKYLLEHKFINIGIMGWSQGGTIALLSSNIYRFKAMVLWAAAVDMSSMITEQDYMIAKENGYTVKSFEWRTPLKFSYEWMCDVKTTDVLSNYSQSNIPTLALNGKNDDVVLPINAINIINKAQHKDSMSHIIENTDHVFGVFDDKEKFEEICNKTISWFKRYMTLEK